MMKPIAIIALALAGTASGFAPSGGLSARAAGARPSRLHMNLPSSDEEVVVGRRGALKSLFGGVAFGVATASLVASPADALDMDAFMNAELEKDQKNCDPKRDPKCIPKLSSDEALCKYGQSGNARGEACKRVKAAGGDISQKAGGKSLGGAYAM